ncbi:MAG: hypothetical protein HQ528_05600, partial [Candidatus Marinimicrobia bacterium]|nr:hypothetical protein [Candidatus Neomarinimicrobiota bacterium]
MKSRLIISIAILIIFMPLIVIGQEVIQISAGDYAIDDAIYLAQAGDTLELTTNGGYYHEGFTITIDKPLTIRAKSGLEVKPVWYCDEAGRIITVLDDLTLQGITFDGSLGSFPTERCIGTDSSGTGVGTKLDYKLIIDDCDFINFNVGSGRAIYGHPDSQADSVIITNSYFAHINDRAIYFKDPRVTPSVYNFIIENCTFWDIGADVIYVDNFEDVLTTDMSFSANHVTIHDPGMVDAAIKSIYPKYIDGAMIKNSMVTRTTESTATDPARIYGENSAALYLLDWNVDNISLQQGASIDDSTGTNYLHEVDPLYFDASVGDFYLDENSPAAGFGEDSATLGDLRWDGYRGITIDGIFSDWPEWTRLDTGAVNNPAYNDTTELKAFYFTYDSNKIALRADFFGQCDWRGGETSGIWNINSGAMRIYFKDPVGNKYRIRLYQNSIDSSYTVAKLLLEEGPDFPGLDSGRKSGMAQWNSSGTSVEIFFPTDSLAVPLSEWDPDSSIQARFYVLAGWGGYDNKLPPDGSYYWFKLSDVDPIDPPLSVDDGISVNLPTKYLLSQNYPNPFNPTTTIEYSIPVHGQVSMKVYSILGQTIATLIEQEQSAGKYSLNWNAIDDRGKQVASG